MLGSLSARPTWAVWGGSPILILFLLTHRDLCSSLMIKSLLVWPAKTLTAGLTPASMMLDKGYPMEKRHFEPFFSRDL